MGKSFIMDSIIRYSAGRDGEGLARWGKDTGLWNGHSVRDFAEESEEIWERWGWVLDITIL
jgi:hypothetical protein